MNRAMNRHTIAIVVSVGIAGIAAAVAVAQATGTAHRASAARYPAAHYTIVPLSLGVFNGPVTALDRAEQVSPAVARSVNHLLSDAAGVPPEFDPGAKLDGDLRAPLTSLGTKGRTIYLVRTAKGRVCGGLTGFAAGCLEGLPASVPITVMSGDPDATGVGEAPLVWGVARNDVVAVDVVVNGAIRHAELSRNAYFFQLRDAAEPDAAIEAVVAYLRGGGTYREVVNHGPATDLPLITGPPEAPSQ